MMIFQRWHTLDHDYDDYENKMMMTTTIFLIITIVIMNNDDIIAEVKIIMKSLPTRPTREAMVSH
jgi:hypothetical protein